MLDALRQHLTVQNIALDLTFLAVVILTWFMPRLGDRAFTALEEAGAAFARKRVLAIASVALAAAVLRVSLLWLVPVPVPHTHDEFSYLLAADTFAHGRVTNPPHPMAIFLDTIHVNQQPTYMSKYPPAQGAALAVGQVLGNPWIGVVLSVAAMCAAVVWMLQGWVPARWALLGGVLVLMRFGIFSYWMNSYWGGAIPATGGALIMGALPRIVRSWRPWDAVVMGIGVGLLMNSRPLEGFFLFLPVVVFFLAWFWRERSLGWGVAVRRFIVPLGAVAATFVAFSCYYNWRGTGHPLLPPYLVNERTYVSTPTLLWQKAQPPIQFQNQQLDAFYNIWVREESTLGRSDTFFHAAKHLGLDGMKFVNTFLWPELFLPLLAIWWMLRDSGVPLLIAQVAICFCGFVTVAWFQPHYAAPLLATVFALLVQAMRHLRRWECHGRSVGIGLTRTIVTFAVLLAPFHPHGAVLGHPAPAGIEFRPRIEARLNAAPGMHLVIVRYAPRRDPRSLEEWVYNGADVDHAKVVWAREIPGISLLPLLEHFKSRSIWLVEVDVSPVHLVPYTPYVHPREGDSGRSFPEIARP
jgi:hypothetical protein